MTRRLLILFFILISSLSILWSQETTKDNQLRNLVKEYKEADVSIPYPGSSNIKILSKNVSITSVKDKIVFITISFRTIDWFITSKFDYTIIPRVDNKGMVSPSSVKQAMNWQSYPSYIQYDSILQSFAANYPSLCHVDTIGTSINGRIVFALKISDNVGTNENEPEVFYTSTMHGNETGGYILMLRLADYLLTNYSLNSRVKNMVDNLQIWINPLANPDGTYNGGNTVSSPTRTNAEGYDLNRSFPDPLDLSIYTPKENVDMMKFMRKHNFIISANFHAGAEVVNYPWDRWIRLHPDNTWFYNISRSYADTVHAHSIAGYMTAFDNGITNGYAWYDVIGGRQDFVTWELQGREVTIELDYTKFTPAGDLEALWESNFRSLLGYLENALYGIQGLVKDLDTDEPVPARIFITGHDADNSHIYSDTLSGSFTRLLAPGSWNITFSANGYRDTTIFNVVVIEGQKTDLIVEMSPIITRIDTTKREKPFLYPNPASSLLKAKLPESLGGLINIRIIRQSGAVVAEFNRDYTFGYTTDIDVRGLSTGIYTVIFRNKSSGIEYRSRIIIL